VPPETIKKVAATRGHKVSLADLFGETEARADESAILGSRAGTLRTANFYGCLLGEQVLVNPAFWLVEITSF
jgi:hypothetical protein